ncbi:MAG: hypothetical protein BWX80_03425 [Candidatus Hydrogenedentes bacterium ADurb.Bin101]|nr:MAG: hypothetical protein BWX80_03425 [Candidatus Hydrogenedentes bacterium ADurb.Bin101]
MVHRFFRFSQARQFPAQGRMGILEVRVQGQGFPVLFDCLVHAAQPAEFLRPKITRPVKHRVQANRLRKVVQSLFRAARFRQVAPEDIVHKRLIRVFRQEALIPFNDLFALLQGFHGKADVVDDITVFRRDLERPFKAVQGLFIPFLAVIQFSQDIQGARIVGIQCQCRKKSLLRRVRIAVFLQGRAEQVEQILVPGIASNPRFVLGDGLLQQAVGGEITAQPLMHIRGACVRDNLTGLQAGLFNFAAPNPRIGPLIVPARLVCLHG